MTNHPHRAKPPVAAPTLYFTDNGAMLCDQHLGATAKMTGRDLSGQRIAKVTAADRRELAAMGCMAKCEVCGNGGAE